MIYTKRNNNSIVEKFTEYLISAMMRAITNGHVTGNIGATMELFCTKDSEWSYQSEWRLIAKAGTTCNRLKIKAIYLGFKVNKTNEERMRAISSEVNMLKGFSKDYPKYSNTFLQRSNYFLIQNLPSSGVSHSPSTTCPGTDRRPDGSCRHPR